MLVDKKIPGKVARLDATYDALRFAVVASLSIEMAETLEHFRSAGAAEQALDWRPVTAGDRWGDSWWSTWFRGNVAVPADFGGGPVFLRAQTGATECALLVDGRHQGVFDVNHPVRLVDLDATAGKTYSIYLEGYAGHTFPGTQSFDEPRKVSGGAPQDTGKSVGRNARQFDCVDLVAERDDVSRFVFELCALRQLSEVLDEHSLRRGRIQAALAQVFALVYQKPGDVPEPEWLAALARAREVMAPLLALTNVPTMGIIGHSHIDTA